MAAVQKILIHSSGSFFYVKELNADFHTQYGYISKAELRKSGEIKSNTGEIFHIINALFSDKLHKLKRGAQIITLKDAGIIAAETGINHNSAVLDAGGGSGALACFLGNLCKQVYTYEIREDFCKIISENVDNLGLDNVKVINKDVTKGISEKNLDLIVLDMPDPSKAVPHAIRSLKAGGFLLFYMPSMTQVIKAVKQVRKNKSLILIKVVESLQRQWKVEDKICRPEFEMLGHTGFLAFARKIK